MLQREKYEVYGFDSSLDKPGSVSNSVKAVKSPAISQGESLCDFLIDYKQEHFPNDKPVLIPASDDYAGYIAMYDPSLSRHFDYILPEISLLKNILDKKTQLSIVSEMGIKVPFTFKIENEKELEDLRVKINFPVIIKPGNAGEWKKHFNFKAIKVSSDGEFAEKIREALRLGLKVIVQEIIPGDCTNNFEVSTYVSSNGKICGLFTIRKIRQYPMEFGYGCLVETCTNKTVEKLAEKFLTELKWRGFANLEFKFDKRTGEYYFIEVNPRVWQQIELPYEAGKINYPVILVNDLDTEAIPDTFTFKNGIKWIDVFSDMLSSLSLIKKGKLTIGDWRKSLKNTKKYGLASFKDPMPVMKDLNYGLKIFLAPLKLLKSN